MIIDINMRAVYFINHIEKYYFETTLPLDITKVVSPLFLQLFSTMGADIKVSPNGQKKKIRNWNCTGYNIEMDMYVIGMRMLVKSTCWATTEVPFDWPSYKESLIPIITAGTLFHSQIPIHQDTIAGFMKIKGFVVSIQSYVNVRGSEYKLTSKIVEMTQKIAPTGTYEIPAGYIKKDRLFAE